MVQIEGAIVKEQGVTFAIAVVKPYVIDSPNEREKASRLYQGVFQRMPIVLMSQDSQGIPRYWGRKDIVNFLARVPVYSIPWKRYNIS